MKITSTKDAKCDGVKVLVYGPSGVGKTVLCSTAPDPIIISAERGLLSLAGVDIPVMEVTGVKDLNEAYREACKGPWQTVCLDSISEIAEVVLAEYKGVVNDGRQAYGMLNDTMSKIIRQFRDISGKHVVFTAKELREEGSSGVMTSRPSMPGKTLTSGISYYFDLVLFMKSTREERLLHTKDTAAFNAKDRSARLEKTEQPNLTNVFNKVQNGTN